MPFAFWQAVWTIFREALRDLISVQAFFGVGMQSPEDFSTATACQAGTSLMGLAIAAASICSLPSGYIGPTSLLKWSEFPQVISTSLRLEEHGPPRNLCVFEIAEYRRTFPFSSTMGVRRGRQRNAYGAGTRLEYEMTPTLLFPRRVVWALLEFGECGVST